MTKKSGEIIIVAIPYAWDRRKQASEYVGVVMVPVSL